MNDEEANKVIFVILIFIILGILFILNIFAKAYVWNNMLDKIRNNSGNYTATKILMMFTAFIAISFLIYWLFSSKTIVRHSLMRGKDKV
jgi:uncharacterized BrkB/YihY/UPF0761 family membrane protein